MNKIEAKLIRVEESDEGTIGVLVLRGSAFCVTLEPPDRDNAQNVSCIPVGKYTCKRVQSPKYGDTFEISGVPNRSHVLLHAGNVVKNTKGCVLLGQYFGKLKGDRAVLNSGKTFNTFMTLMNVAAVDEFELEIKEA